MVEGFDHPSVLITREVCIMGESVWIVRQEDSILQVTTAKALAQLVIDRRVAEELAILTDDERQDAWNSEKSIRSEYWIDGPFPVYTA